jgi:hypothetical protein
MNPLLDAQNEMLRLHESANLPSNCRGARASRVNPFGALFVTEARGHYMGNRGGRIHVNSYSLGNRRYISSRWICCCLEFKGRRRRVWSDSYTELFFLDEPTALAAGHRPCFECRRRDASDFAERWRRSQRLNMRPRAAEMDKRLHAERLDGRYQRRHAAPFTGLPDGTFVVVEGRACAVRGKALLHWTPAGYATWRPRPGNGMAELLTPPAIVAVLAAGYSPRWHPSCVEDAGERR